MAFISEGVLRKMLHKNIYHARHKTLATYITVRGNIYVEMYNIKKISLPFDTEFAINGRHYIFKQLPSPRSKNHTVASVCKFCVFGSTYGINIKHCMNITENIYVDLCNVFKCERYLNIGSYHQGYFIHKRR